MNNSEMKAWGKAYRLFHAAVTQAHYHNEAQYVVHDGLKRELKIVQKKDLDNSPFRYTVAYMVSPNAQPLLTGMEIATDD